MTTYEIKQRILNNQHLTNKADKLTVAHDLCGVQAQFMVNAFHSLKIRCKDEIFKETWGGDLVKNWTIRGTVHVFAEDDLPIFKHEINGSNYLSHDWLGEKYNGNWLITPNRQRFFAEYIVDCVARGICAREELKNECFKNGMTETENSYIFNSWGGLLRGLCERGFLNYKVQEKKEFLLSPKYMPLEEEEAKLMIARRYFTYFAPATIKDAAYYFHAPQAEVKIWISKLPISTIEAEGKTYYYIENTVSDFPDIPKCILLAGFDQLMLGYQKQQSLFLPLEHLRGIFNLAGIVMPSVLLDGKVVGKWKKEKTKVTFTLFESIDDINKKSIVDTAEQYWSDIKKIIWK